MRQLTPYIVDYTVKEKFISTEPAISSGQSSQQVDTCRTPAVMLESISTSGASRVLLVKAPYHTSCGGLENMPRKGIGLAELREFSTVISKSCGSQEVKFLENSKTVKPFFSSLLRRNQS